MHAAVLPALLQAARLRTPAAAAAAAAAGGGIFAKPKLARAGFLGQSGSVGSVDCPAVPRVELAFYNRCCCGAVSSFLVVCFPGETK